MKASNISDSMKLMKTRSIVLLAGKSGVGEQMKSGVSKKGNAS